MNQIFFSDKKNIEEIMRKYFSLKGEAEDKIFRILSASVFRCEIENSWKQTSFLTKSCKEVN